MDLSRLTSRAKDIFAKRGGTEAAKKDAQELKDIARSDASLGDKAKAKQIAQKADVWTLDIQGEEWGEVDFPEDVEAARALVERWDRGQGAAAA